MAIVERHYVLNTTVQQPILVEPAARWLALWAAGRIAGKFFVKAGLRRTGPLLAAVRTGVRPSTGELRR